MRFGLLGCGVIGRTHAELIASMPDRAALAAVADLDAAAAGRLGERYGVPALCGLDELLARPDVDAVSICLPNGMHADAAVAAMRAGRHVLVEKPIDITLAAADRVIQAERETGMTAGVVSQRRFQPAFAFVHDAVAAGRLGRLTSGSVQTPFWRSQRYYESGGWHGTLAVEGGGALVTQGAHAVDLLIWLLGEPVRISAYAATLAHEGIDVEDTLAATVQFDGGAIGTFSATTAAYPGMTVRLQVSGDQGSAVVERERLEYFHTVDGEAGAASQENQVATTGAAQHPSTVEVAHAAQYADFVDAVEHGRPPAITTADARATLALMLAAYESARRAGAPVDVDRPAEV